MRVILSMGKGGVGKTSVAASTALKAAQAGYKTLVMSTDVAHSLGDSLDTELGPAPTQVSDNLFGQEIDVYRELETHWRTVQDWLVTLLQWQGADEVVAEEMAILPGMEEVVGLIQIAEHHDAGEFDLLVVDCAPTGETLRLLSFPEAARWYMKRLFPLERRVASALGPVARGMFRVPMPQQEVFDSAEDLYNQLQHMNEILRDRDLTSVRIVVNPEKMVIKEAQRAYTYLSLYGYPTDAVICNRVLPDEADGEFVRAWRESQSRYLKMVREAFTPVPTFIAPMLNREVVGLEALEELGTATYGGQDPAQFFYRGRIQEVTREEGNPVLRIDLPYLETGLPDISQNGDELVIQAGRYRRTLVLPRSIAGDQVHSATMEGDTLKLVFETHEKPATAARR